MGGLIAKAISFVRAKRGTTKVIDVKCDTGGGKLITTELSQPSGDDAPPLGGDYLAILRVKRSGSGMVVGIVDPESSQKANGGEKRIYGRDADGAEVCEIWLKNDGSIKAENKKGSFELGVDGTFSVNGVTIDSSGNIITKGSVTMAATVTTALSIGGVNLPASHTHLYTDTGNPVNPQSTQAPTPST